jgi:hypothetical protein
MEFEKGQKDMKTNGLCGNRTPDFFTPRRIRLPFGTRFLGVSLFKPIPIFRIHWMIVPQISGLLSQCLRQA